MASIERKIAHDENLGYAFFDSDVNDEDAWKARVPFTGLLEKYDQVTRGIEERIIKIMVHRSPLSSFQITQQLFYHAFLVVTTNHWNYSFEVDNRNITIQRAQNIEAVRDFALGERRKVTLLRGIFHTSPSPSVLVSTDAYEGTVRELMQYFIEADLFNHKYNVLADNCQTQAGRMIGCVRRLRRKPGRNLGISVKIWNLF